MKTADQTEGNFTPAERRCVTALNAAVQGIAIRAVIFQRGLGDHEYEVRIDGHPMPDSPVRGFATVEQGARAAKEDLGRWILEVLERVTQQPLTPVRSARPPTNGPRDDWAEELTPAPPTKSRVTHSPLTH